jgi:L-asparaginase II
MNNPVLVEALRGSLVESRHAGAVAVFDENGKAVFVLGDIDRPVFPRSAVKSIQALPLVESGAADAFGFGDKELALACASHAAEPAHVALAADMLGKASLDATALECGAHWPSSHQAMIALARSGGTPSALHNNCSGKHAGFLCSCRHLHIEHRGYIRPDHPYQEIIRRTMGEVTGAHHDERNRGIDGCSIPTYAIPLRHLAIGFARMATAKGFPADRAAAARRLLDACMAEPFYVSGSGKADLRLMQAAPGRIFVKTGAEGVYCGAVPEFGLGIAVKCDDGQGRASEVAVATVLAKLLGNDAAVQAALAELLNPPLKNWNGIHVGELRPAVALH